MPAADIIIAERPLSFIIVDDNKISNHICKFTLLKANKSADIQSFTDPEDAIVSISQNIGPTGSHVKTILLLDINMPIMSGWEFLDEFSKFGDAVCSRFTIYIFSSSIDSEDWERANSHALVSAMFSKPLKSMDLEKIWQDYHINTDR